MGKNTESGASSRRTALELRNRINNVYISPSLGEGFGVGFYICRQMAQATVPSPSVVVL